VLEFLREKLWEPIATGEGYNPFNTGVYAVLFIALVELYWRFARRFDQEEFRNALLPFVVAAGAVRFLDGRLLPHSALTVTPGIFLLTLMTFTALYSWLGAERAQKAGLAMAGLSAAACLPYLGLARAYYTLPVAAIYLAVGRLYSRWDFMADDFAWKPHLFEAWVTSFGVLAGLREEHVIAGALMQSSPFVFGAVKTLLLPVIMLLLRDTEERQRKYVGTAIGALGLGPGIRDLLELLSVGG
jgi:uncharacterized membrane protein